MGGFFPPNLDEVRDNLVEAGYRGRGKTKRGGFATACLRSKLMVFECKM